MGVVDCVIVLRSVPLERDAAIASGALYLVENALRKALGDEQIVPEWECSVDSGSGLCCCTHLSIGVSVGVYGCDANDAVDSKYAARAASAVEPDGPG